MHLAGPINVWGSFSCSIQGGWDTWSSNASTDDWKNRRTKWSKYLHMLHKSLSFHAPQSRCVNPQDPSLWKDTILPVWLCHYIKVSPSWFIMEIFIPRKVVFIWKWGACSSQQYWISSPPWCVWPPPPTHHTSSTTNPPPATSLPPPPHPTTPITTTTTRHITAALPPHPTTRHPTTTTTTTTHYITATKNVSVPSTPAAWYQIPKMSVPSIPTARPASQSLNALRDWWFYSLKWRVAQTEISSGQIIQIYDLTWHSSHILWMGYITM